MSFVTRVAMSPYRNLSELPPLMTQSGMSCATIVFAGYEAAKYDLPVKPTVAEAVVWANELIDRIAKA